MPDVSDSSQSEVFGAARYENNWSGAGLLSDLVLESGQTQPGPADGYTGTVQQSGVYGYQAGGVINSSQHCCCC